MKRVPGMNKLQRHAHLLLVLLAVVGLQACAMTRVASDFRPQYDFLALHSFRMLPSPQPDEVVAQVSPLNLERIEAALQQELSGRYSLVTDSAAPADFLVQYHVLVKEKMQIMTNDFPFSRMCCYDRVVGPYGPYGPYGGSVDVNQYTEETLIVDILDGKTEKQIWRGSTRYVATVGKSPLEKTEFLHKKVSEILSKFPPQVLAP